LLKFLPGEVKEDTLKLGGLESDNMAKRDHSHTDRLSKSDALFEEIFDIALTEDQRKKKTGTHATKTVVKPREAGKEVRSPKKKIMEAPPLKRSVAPRSTQSVEPAPPKKTRSGRLTKILIGILFLAGVGGMVIFLLPAVKLPDLFHPAQEPPPVKLEMPPKPPPQETAQAPFPSPAPVAERVSETSAQEGFLPSVEMTKEIEKIEEREAAEERETANEGEAAKAIESPKAEDSAKAVKKMDPVQTTSYPYSIYLGSFRKEDVLQKALENYRDKGLSPYPVRVDLGTKGVWFRVFAGHFETRGKAEAFIEKHEIPDAETRNTKFAVLIGTHASRPEAEAKLRDLGGRGCHPYIIEEIPFRLRVYTGAFYREEDAKAELAWLASKGVQGRIVER
jgi:cell division septation protein DedD